MAEKYTPKSGDTVAVVSDHYIGKGTVSRVLKLYCEVLVGKQPAQRFSLRDLQSVGRASYSDVRIEFWTDAHTEAVARRQAMLRIRGALDALAMVHLDRLPTARLDAATAFLRGLAADAKAAK